MKKLDKKNRAKHVTILDQSTDKNLKIDRSKKRKLDELAEETKAKKSKLNESEEGDDFEVSGDENEEVELNEDGEDYDKTVNIEKRLPSSAKVIKCNDKTGPSKNEIKKKIFFDGGLINSESLKNEIKNRIENRRKRTVVMIGINKDFNNSTVSQNFPDRISAIIPFNTMSHMNSGKAYIDFDSVEAAQRAIKKLNGKKIFSMQLKDINPDDYNCNKLAVSNINFQTKMEELKSIFPKAVEITFLPIKFQDRRMTRVAFVEYKSIEDAIGDYDSKHGIEVNGNPLNINFQQKSNTNIHQKKATYNQPKLTISGIKKNTKKDELMKLFPQATSINLLADKALAIAVYDTVEECVVDKDNAIKNKPYNNMRILFDIRKDKQFQKKSKNQKQPHSNKLPNRERNVQKSQSKMNKYDDSTIEAKLSPKKTVQKKKGGKNFKKNNIPRNSF